MRLLTLFSKKNLLPDNHNTKITTIRNLVNQGYYVVVEVKGNTGEHWVAVDGVDGDKVYDGSR